MDGEERRRDFRGYDGRLGRLEERTDGLQRRMDKLESMQTWQNRFAIGTLVTAVAVLAEWLRHP